MMKNIVILELEKYNELINKINELENEKMVLLNEHLESQSQLDLWINKVDEIDEQFRGLFKAVVSNEIASTNEVMMYDINDRDTIAKYINENLKCEFYELKEEQKCK